MKRFIYLLSFTVVLSLGLSSENQVVKAEEERPCYTNCQTWSWQAGYDFGCSISHQSNHYFDYLYYNYRFDCGCTTYAAGMLEGYGNCGSGNNN